MKYNNSYFTREATTGYDAGLRIVGSSEQLAVMLFSTPLAYAVMFAPLIYIFFFSRKFNGHG